MRCCFKVATTKALISNAARDKMKTPRLRTLSLSKDEESKFNSTQAYYKEEAFLRIGSCSAMLTKDPCPFIVLWRIVDHSLILNWVYWGEY